jgi:excisionase family DNA binding protein
MKETAMRSNQKSRSGDMDINPRPEDLTKPEQPQKLDNRTIALSKVHEVSETLRISYRAVLREINNGKLEAHRFGGEFRISDEQIENYLRNTVTDKTDNSNVQDDPAA